MRRSKPLAVIAGAALLTLAACGGGGGDDGSEPTTERTYKAQGTNFKDAKRQAPAPDVEGATTGGTITVYNPADPGPDDLDPTAGWSVTGNSIQQALTNRSLTQYAKDPETGEMLLVPDLATDLGTPNEDYTEWTFTIRDGVKWETGDPITAEEVAFGLTRSMDETAFPGGPGTTYSEEFFKGATDYKGPYTDPKTKYDGITFDNDEGTVTIQMEKPFPDMDYWGAFMAMGPIPLENSSPPDYGKKPLATGPYKVESFTPNEELILVKNDQWDPATDPGRHQYVDGWDIKFNSDQAKSDEIILSGNTASQTAMTLRVGSDNYVKADEVLGDRLLQQSGQCVSYLYPVYEKTTLNVRKALAYAYPYEDAWTASGEVAGVTRTFANSIMPPGMAGKKEYFVDGEQFTFQPEKSKQLLADEGYEAGEYKITMIYYEADSTQVEAYKQIKAGFEEGGFTVKGIPVQDDPYNTWTDQESKLHKQLNLQQVNWCSDWPSGSTMLPPLIQTGETYNTGAFSEKWVDDEIQRIYTIPLEEQADAWGALDEKVSTELFPIIPTAFRNDLYGFGERIGNPSGDGSIGAPNFKDLYVIAE